MKDPISKAECVGLADLFTVAYYGWCKYQHIAVDEAIADEITDLAAEIENRIRAAKKKKACE